MSSSYLSITIHIKYDYIKKLRNQLYYQQKKTYNLEQAKMKSKHIFMERVEYKF